MSKIAFTASRVTSFKCPPDKQQAFLWDTGCPGLGLRATPNGQPAYIFQSSIRNKTLRITIGTPAAWAIKDAQARAREFQRLIDQGQDPRVVVAQQVEAHAALRQQAQAQVMTVSELWSIYIEERKAHWGEHHLKDHISKASLGGVASRRGGQLTTPGPLAALMLLKVTELTAERIEAWAAREAKTRPTSARGAWRLLKGFLSWSSQHKEYKGLVPSDNPAKTAKSKEAFGKPGVKKDVLGKDDLPAWFEAVRAYRNPTISAYLQICLITGARPGEVIGIRWSDVNWRKKSLTIRDKIDGERVIPLTPYAAHLLQAQPKRNEWVFSSSTSANGRLTAPNHAHDEVCRAADIDRLTLHGLRRSFTTLSDWTDIPGGVVLQLQGHKPSGTVEKHYKKRALDLLTLFHGRIEAWILEQAGVEFTPAEVPVRLKVVA